MIMKEMVKEFIINKMNGDDDGLIEYVDNKTKERTTDDIKKILDENGICYGRNDSRQELIRHIFGQLNLLLGRKILSAIVLKENNVSQKELYKAIYCREYL